MLRWSRVPETPNSPGVGGAFLGTSGETLILAGGSNFPIKPAWEGGNKVWHKSIYGIGPRQRKWNEIGELPRALAYGVGVSIRQGLLMIGGADAEKHYQDCYVLSVENEKCIIRPFPFLPRPLAYATGALVGSKVIVAGGTETPDATAASSAAYAIDLANLMGGWKELPLWAGSGRMLAQSAGIKDTFFLFGGVSLVSGSKGTTKEYLTDCHAFTLGKTWRRLSAMPYPLAAAPSPCPVIQDEIFLLGGDDGSLAGKIEAARHPGFSSEILVYNKATDTWSQGGKTPAALIATGCTKWNQGFAYVNGETRPSQRSSEGWLGSPST